MLVCHSMHCMCHTPALLAMKEMSSLDVVQLLSLVSSAYCLCHVVANRPNTKLGLLEGGAEVPRFSSIFSRVSRTMSVSLSLSLCLSPASAVLSQGRTLSEGGCSNGDTKDCVV